MAELPTESIASAVERAAAAYEALAGRAEAVEDEWQYVTDLVAAYLPSLRSLADGREQEKPTPEVAEALAEAIAEIELISDPHKAIDWLSTFPHVVALALGGDVDRGSDGDPASAGRGEPPGGPGPDEPDEPDEDSPFRILLRGGR